VKVVRIREIEDKVAVDRQRGAWRVAGVRAARPEHGAAGAEGGWLGQLVKLATSSWCKEGILLASWTDRIIRSGEVHDLRSRYANLVQAYVVAVNDAKLGTRLGDGTAFIEWIGALLDPCSNVHHY